MSKIVDINDFRKELNRRAFCEKVKGAAYKVQDKVQDFIERNNKELLIVMVPVVISGLVTVSKVVVKRGNLNKEQQLKEKYCYDRSLGHYWALKRQLSNKEWLEIDKRKRNGEKLSDILSEMKVLK